MNCTKYLCKIGYRFFLTIVAISASFVTCCMSINTADFLCQWIVHVLGIILLFFYCCYSFWGVLEVVSELSRPTGVCTEPAIVSSTLSRLLYSSWEKNGLIREEEKNEILDYFDSLVLDYITKLSGVQSVIAECSLYICVHSILQEKKSSRVTKYDNNAIDLVIILFNIISINKCCLPPKTGVILFSLKLIQFK